MKKILFLYLSLLSIVLIAKNNNSPIFIEHNSLILDSEQIEVISYRIPYKNLLFTKNNDQYTSSFTLTLEFFKEDEFVFREILNPSLSTDNYNQTLSNEIYFQDFVKLKIEKGNYKLRTILSLRSTELEYRIPEQNLEIKSLIENKIIGPIIVSPKLTKPKQRLFLSNYSNRIPFSENQVSLLVGLSDYEMDTISVSISQDAKVIYANTVKMNFSGGVELNGNGKNISIVQTEDNSVKYFVISNFSHLLYEGSAKLNIKVDTSNYNFPLTLSWIGKPNILNNPEYSIKLVGYIDNEGAVGELLSNSSEDYYKELTEYWIAKYPSDGMKYNFAMEEYYSRADHAIKNYSSLNSFDGAERDRGKIYILYGEPESVDRNYTEMNEIVEVWNYDELGRTFIFKDINGTGKFDQVK